MSRSFVLLALTLIFACRPQVAVNQEIPFDQNNEYERALAGFNLASRMANYGVPGVSFAVIRDGDLSWAKGYGLLQTGQPEAVDQNTVFSVGSVSKVGTAVITLRLRQLEKLDVDTDVNQYLQSWKIPENDYTQTRAVTLRHIMSHTGGLTVHGFADFYPGENQPNTVEILNGNGPAKNDAVYVSRPVGRAFRYSGGGTTIEQLVVEDGTGLRFHEAADSLLFQPLGMDRSSYENPLPQDWGNIAKAHDRSGRPVALPRGYQSMPETAASGLWTTPSDFAKLMMMLMRAYRAHHTYLSQEIVQDMMTPVHPSDYGLGPRIQKKGGDIQFSHGGSNESYKARFIGSLSKQSGIVIFTNGAQGSALIRELLPLFEELLF